MVFPPLCNWRTSASAALFFPKLPLWTIRRQAVHDGFTSPVADRGAGYLLLRGQKKLTEEKAAPMSHHCRGDPVLLAVKSGCGSRSKLERTHKGCELRQVLAEISFHGCDCSVAHEGG
jgi:hypothetical protein